MGLVIRENRIFIFPFLLFATLFLILIGKHGNHQLFLYVNSHHSSAFDFIFLYWTNLGDGIIAALLILILLWVSYREALTFLVITLLITILVNLFKDYIYPELNRPVAFFGTAQFLHLIPGYKPPMLSTFPSGHTATAFSVGLYLCFVPNSDYF
jgi:membrane-associated phospholipid phosphatase